MRLPWQIPIKIKRKGPPVSWPPEITIEILFINEGSVSIKYTWPDKKMARKVRTEYFGKNDVLNFNLSHIVDMDKMEALIEQT